jgi:hypothetical protein
MDPARVKYLSNLVTHAAHQKKLPEIEWEKEWDEGLNGQAVLDILNDTLADEEIEGGWTDVGIGAYEYWGFRGTDSRMAVEVSDIPRVIIRLKGRDHVVPLPDKKLKMSYSGGGCDGEHSGRCRGPCAEWDATIEWEVVHQELRGTDLYVVCEGEQA